MLLLYISIKLLIIVLLSLGFIVARVIALQGKWFAKVKSNYLTFKKQLP